MAQFLLYSQNAREFGVGSITFDLILSETHTFNNKISDYNVEDGSIISDHIQNELEQGSLSGLFTNFSIFRSTAGNTSQEAFNSLYELWKKRELVTIGTVLKLYENMAITSISMGKSADDGESIVANISFRQVNVVKLQSVEITAAIKIEDLKTDKNKQIAPKNNKGNTVPKK
jgi:hypothetical protein